MVDYGAMEHKHAEQIAYLLKDFGEEIQSLTGAKINTDTEQITRLVHEELDKSFFGFCALEDEKVVGFVTFYKSFALYAGGSYFTVTELYVTPEQRSKSIGKVLLGKVQARGEAEGMSRVELTTPPLPQFQRSFDFYLANGFEVTGGKKLKYELPVK